MENVPFSAGRQRPESTVSLPAPRNAEIARVPKAPAVVALADKLGINLVGGTPQQLADLQKADSAKWAKVIKDGNIKAE